VYNLCALGRGRGFLGPPRSAPLSRVIGRVAGQSGASCHGNVNDRCQF